MSNTGRLNCRNDNYILTKLAKMKGHIHKCKGLVVVVRKTTGAAIAVDNLDM